MLCNSHGDTSDGPPTGTIAHGDLVIVYERFDSMKAYDVDASKTYHGRFGLFPVKVYSRFSVASLKSARVSPSPICTCTWASI